MKRFSYATLFSIIWFVLGCLAYRLQGDVHWFDTALKAAITGFFGVCIGYELGKKS